MNKNDRKQLQEAVELISKAMTIVEDVKYSEEEKYENLSEGLKCSERGETFTENVDELDSVITSMEENVSIIENVIDK
jgi:hypothetical protein